MLTEKEFRERIGNLPNVIKSKTGRASYTSFNVKNDILHFQRVVPKTDWDLNLKELYKVYLKHSFIDTSVIKKETGGRVNSPSVALLLATGCIDREGNRI